MEWWIDGLMSAPLFHSWLLLLKLRSLLLLPDAQRRPPRFFMASRLKMGENHRKIMRKSEENHRKIIRKYLPNIRCLDYCNLHPFRYFTHQGPPNKGNHVTCLDHFWPMTLPVLPCSAVVLGLVINSPSSVAAFCLLAKAAEAVFRTQVFRPRFQKQYANKNNNQMTQNISSLQMFCGFRVVLFKCSHNHISLISCFFTTNSPSCLEICHVHTFEAKNLVQRIAQRFPLFLESKKQFLSGFRNPLKSIQIPLWLQIISLCVCVRRYFWK